VPHCQNFTLYSLSLLAERLGRKAAIGRITTTSTRSSQAGAVCCGASFGRGPSAIAIAETSASVPASSVFNFDFPGWPAIGKPAFAWD
jgi:hypothetical protein